MKIAVAGGTGVLGRHLVEAVRAAGHKPVVLARSTGVDLTTGAGLVDALDGADTVIDASNVTTGSRSRAVAFFEAATRNLVAIAAKTGTAHVVAISIVGIDRVPLAYYAGKVRQEQILAESDVPYSIVRATQFHEFTEQVLGRVPGPVAIMPKMRIQPIAAAEVAHVLTELAAGKPTPMTELAGPQEEYLPDLAHRLLRSLGSHRPVWAVRLPAKGGKAMAAGGNLPMGDYRRGTQTFDDWLRRNAR